ncbi:MAG: lysophospholipid acyltransferase family protein [Bacillota bacterium]|nr:lysophospholipid acyltransferase family protein [Bacillota bacterium]
MKTIFIYVYCGIYLFLTLFFRLKLAILRRTKSQQEVEDYIHKKVFTWSNKVMRVVGVKTNVIGMENLPKGACLFVSNHQGNFDFFTLLANIDKPMGFVAKKEIAKLNITASWMRDMHCVFIDRDSIRDSLKAINEAVENLKNGYSMVIFPEGTRSKGPGIGEFKKGSMKLGIKADVPVVPVAIEGTYKAFEANKNKFKSAEVTLSILEPINVDLLSKEEKANLAEILQEKIHNELLRIQTERK